MKIGFDAYVVDNPMVGDVKSEMGRSRPGLIRSGKNLNLQVDQRYINVDHGIIVDGRITRAACRYLTLLT